MRFEAKSLISLFPSVCMSWFFMPLYFYRITFYNPEAGAASNLILFFFILLNVLARLILMAFSNAKRWGDKKLLVGYKDRWRIAYSSPLVWVDLLIKVGLDLEVDGMVRMSELSCD